MSIGLAPLSRWLESSGRRSPGLEMVASAWSAISASRVRRKLTLPHGSKVIGIGGTTLGGSYKTPFAIAVARALAERGERVALVGHAYRAKPGSARGVAPADEVRLVGDEALLAARILGPLGIDVVVADSRRAALDFAARRAEWLVADGLLQARPHRIARSMLVVDEISPWGSGRCPPAGDLRAPRPALLAATDALVVVADEVTSSSRAKSSIHGAIDPSGATVALSELGGAPFGLLLAIARPDRVVRSLARRGLRAAATIELADHAAPTLSELEQAASRTERVEAWLTTQKCAVKLPHRIGRAPILALDHRIELPKALVDWALSKGPLPALHCPSSPGQKPW
jgi:tetraacyldisaccharide 4'-kinase